MQDDAYTAGTVIGLRAPGTLGAPPGRRPGAAVALLLALGASRSAGQTMTDPAAVDTGRGRAVRVLVLAPRVLRFLALQFHHYTDEFGACLLGERRGDTLFVVRADPADVDPADVTPIGVNWRRSCEETAPGSVGMIHSHVRGAACYFQLPRDRPAGVTRTWYGGDSVWTQDAVSFFRRPAHAVTAIMCGEAIVWMSRDSVTRVASLPDSLRASQLNQYKPRDSRARTTH
jgi:hypothetical protein